MSLTEAIAGHIASYRPADLPPETRHATARALLDGCGVMLAATALSDAATPYRRLAEASGAGPARLLGSAQRVAPAAAALGNGALAHALDFGDTFDAGPAHPNAALIPALLALADAEPAIDGARFVAAMALGSDLACRLSRVAGPAIEQHGWYPPPLYGLLGAAAGCAYLLGLDAAGVTNAIGLAYCGAAFPGEIKHDAHSPLRGVREAFAAQAAVTAALLARAGAQAFAAPLEGMAGFFATYAGGAGDPSAMLHGLGNTFLGDQVSFKPWPCCRGTHAYIEAGLQLRDRPGFRRDAIETIEVTIGPVQEMLVEPFARKVAPATAIDARFSIPFTVATALIHGAVTLDSFDAAALAAPDVVALAGRVRWARHPDWTRAHAASGAVAIIDQAGNRAAIEILQAAGHPDRPLDDAALIAKFVDCAGRAIPAITPERVTALAQRILSVATLSSVSALLED